MSRTIAQINQYARSITGYEKNSDTDEGFIKDSFILDAINESLNHMSEEKCFSSTGYIQLISGQTEYTLPATFIDLIRNEPITLHNETTGDDYPAILVTQVDMAKFFGNIPQQGTINSAPIQISRKENKLVIRNYTPTSDDTNYYIHIHFYRSHEELTLTTETPYRLNSSSQRIPEDYVISEIFKRDKEYTLSEKHEGKFYAKVQRYKEKEIKNQVRQSSIVRASDYRGSIPRAETYATE